MTNNLIENFTDLKPLADIPSLRTILLTANPVAKIPSYRQQIIDNCPDIETIDHYSTKVKYNVVFKK